MGYLIKPLKWLVSEGPIPRFITMAAALVVIFTGLQFQDALTIPEGNSLSLAVDDSVFVPGGNGVGFTATSLLEGTVVVARDAAMRVGESEWCEVEIYGDRILEQGETGTLSVDGARRFVSPEDGSHKCELDYTVSHPPFNTLTNHVFKFTCTKETSPNLGIEGSDLC